MEAYSGAHEEVNRKNLEEEYLYRIVVWFMTHCKIDVAALLSADRTGVLSSGRIQLKEQQQYKKQQLKQQTTRVKQKRQICKGTIHGNNLQKR